MRYIRDICDFFRRRYFVKMRSDIFEYFDI